MSIQLVILSLLKEKNCYPYEIKRFIKHSKYKELLKVNDGTLYYAFDVLAKNKCILPLETIKEEKRPSKTIYTITSNGEKILVDKILTGLEENDVMSRTFYAALLFSRYADKEDVEYILKKRLKSFKKKLSFVEKQPYNAGPKIGEEIINNALLHIQAEYNWMEKLINSFKNDEILEKQFEFLSDYND